MNVYYKRTLEGKVYMDIPELHSLDASFEKYRNNRGDMSLAGVYYSDLVNFIEFCIAYAEDVFKNKSYSFDHVIPHLFVTSIKSKGQYKQYLRYALYAAMLYAKKLKASLKLSHVRNLDELTFTLCTDYEWLIASYESYVKGVKNVKVRHGSRPYLSVVDIKFGANQLMFAELTDELYNYDFRNTKPCVMFMVRQCLEIMGKRMIGFESINDKHGRPIHQFTQVAWTFLHDMEKQGKQLVQLPMKASSIHQLNSWTNSFVHTSYIYSCYVQFFALEVLNEFSKPVKTPVHTVSGNIQNMQFGDFRIPNLNLLRSEFEQYVTKQHGGYPVKIMWLESEDVGAYILNKGSLPSEKSGFLSKFLTFLKLK